MSTIKLKRSAIQGKIPTTVDLDLGEIALNTYDGKAYMKKNDGSEAVVEIGGGGGGSGITWTVKTANYTALAGDGIVADTSGGSFTITLPASPSAGDYIAIADGASWTNTALIVARNGSTIEGFADDLELDISESKVELIYDGFTWHVYTNTFTNFTTDDWLFKTTNYVASPDDYIIADTSNGAFTVTLPAAPSLGNHIFIADGGDFTINNLIVDPNGNTIENDANNLTIDVSTQVDLIYDGSTWQLQTSVSPNVFSPYPWLIKTSNYSASINDHILADTSSGSFTINLPGNPTTGSHIYIADGDDWGNNALIVDGNGETIEGIANSFTFDISTQADFVYDGTTWQLIVPVQLNTGSGAGAVTIADESASSATHYITFADQTANTETILNVSSTKLTFQPSTGTLTATELNSSSDIYLKENVQTIDNALEKVNAIRGVNFNWKDTGKCSMGVIAQEIEDVIPEVVSSSELGQKSVNYQAIVGLLIEAINEQQKEINKIKDMLS